MRSRILLLSIALLLSIRPASAGWSVERAFDPLQTPSVAMRLAPSGAPLFVFGFNELVAASWNGAGYDLESIDDIGCIGGIYDHTAIAFDPVTGEPVVSYQPAGRGNDIRLARRIAGGWVIESLPGFTFEDTHTALQVDAAGNVYLAWRSQWDAVLRLAIWNGATWAVEEVDAAGGQPAMVLIAGEPVLAYGNTGLMKVAFRSGGVWSIEPVEAVGSTFAPAIAILPGGEPVVSYWDPSDPRFPELHVATRAAGVWTIQAVATGVDNPSAVAVDALGNPHVLYRDLALEQVMLASSDGVSWSYEVVDPAVHVGDGQGWFSLEIAAGAVHAAYVDQTTHQVRHAVRNVPTWDITVVHQDYGFAGEHLALARDAADVPAVAQYDVERRHIALARRSAAPDWTAETVIADLDNWGSLDLAFDDKGDPSVAYFDTDAALWLTHHDGVAWVPESVAPVAPHAGARGSVALAFSPLTGEPTLAARYRSPATDDWSLTFSVRQAGVWSTEVVTSGNGGGDPWGGVPEPPAIAFDAAGEPAIAFFTFDPGAIIVARHNAGAWQLTTVDDTISFYATEVGLAFDPGGQLLVAYRRGSPDNEAMLARGDGVGPWALETVALVDRWQRGMSLAITSAGLPMVGYHGLDTTFLTSFDGATWVPELVDPYSPNADRGSLSLDRVDGPCFAYKVWCLGHVRVVCESNKGRVHRLGVPALDPGWKGAALPLDSLTGDPTPPFPLDVDYPGGGVDPDISTDPLTLYRITLPDDRDTGNRLWLVNVVDGVRLVY